METGYRRRRWTYSFRAWTDRRGSNVDRFHDIMRAPTWNKCLAGKCDHARLWDLNRASDSRNILRVMRRRRPFYFAAVVGSKYRTLVRVGKP